MDCSDKTNEIRDDWNTREHIETICTSIKTVVEFLNRFHSSCRLRLAEMDNKLTSFEKTIEMLDAHVSYSATVYDQIQRNNSVVEQREQ